MIPINTTKYIGKKWDLKHLDLSKSRVHIIGINGVGMSALAIYLKKNNIDVTGSDITYNSSTVNLEKYNIPVYIGHKISNIKDRNLIFFLLIFCLLFLQL